MTATQREPGLWSIVAGVLAASFGSCPTFLGLAAILDAFSLLDDKFLRDVLDQPAVMFFGWEISLLYAAPAALVNSLILVISARYSYDAPWLSGVSGLLVGAVLAVALSVPPEIAYLIAVSGALMGLLQWPIIVRPRRQRRRTQLS